MTSGSGEGAPAFSWPRLMVGAGGVQPDDAAAVERLSKLSADAFGLRACSDALLVAVGEDPGAFAVVSLEFVSVIELVTIIVGGGLSGALEVQTDGRWRRLFFDKGAYVGASSTHKSDWLGEVLWREGTIALDQFMIASEYVTPQKRLGRCLIELGYVAPGQLRAGLRRQARAVFLEACLTKRGLAMFAPGERNTNPVMLLRDADKLIDEAVRTIDACERREQQVGDLDQPCEAVVPAPAGVLTPNEQAMVQLVTSAKRTKTLTRRQVIEKSGLGTVLGLEALANLVSRGHFVEVEAEAEEAAPARPPRLERLVSAINHVWAALDATGFGIGDEIMSFVNDPPEDVAEALSSITLDGPLDAAALRDQAQFTDGGAPALERGLEVLLDFALFEARDYLPEDATRELHRQVHLLDVIPM